MFKESSENTGQTPMTKRLRNIPAPKFEQYQEAFGIVSFELATGLICSRLYDVNNGYWLYKLTSFPDYTFREHELLSTADTKLLCDRDK